MLMVTKLTKKYREECYFLTNNLNAQLIADNSWNNINADFSSTTSEANGAYMYVSIIDLSLNRTLILV